MGFALFACLAIGAVVAPAFAADEPQRLKIIYSSFTEAYAPLWIAVDERLGRKYGLDIEAVYAGRARPHQLLLSGEAQFVVSTGTGVVSSYAVGTKDLVIIASFVNTTGSSIFSKPQIKTAKEFPYVGISTLKVNVKKSPDMTLRLVRTLTDGIQIFKTNKEKSMAVMKRYLRGASDEMLAETYNYFASRMPRLPYPSVEAVKTALDMMSDQFPQASSVDPQEVVDLSFVKQVEAGGAAK